MPDGGGLVGISMALARAPGFGLFLPYIWLSYAFVTESLEDSPIRKGSLYSEVRPSVPPGEGLSSSVSLSSLSMGEVKLSASDDGSRGEPFLLLGPVLVVALVADDEAYCRVIFVVGSLLHVET